MRRNSFNILLIIAMLFSFVSTVHSELISEFYAYPNPVKENQIIHINLKNKSVEDITININIFSLTGKKNLVFIENKFIAHGSGFIYEFNLGESKIPIRPGLYLIIIEARGNNSEKEEKRAYKIFVEEEND
ncbi:MAG: T9SS type A sorting domain-containing protein [bacterium]